MKHVKGVKGHFDCIAAKRDGFGESNAIVIMFCTCKCHTIFRQI